MNDDGRGPPPAPRSDRESRRRPSRSRPRGRAAPPPPPPSGLRTPPSAPRGAGRRWGSSCLLLTHLGPGHDGAHLEDGDDGHEAHEKEEEGEEEAEGTDVGRPVPEGRVVHPPRRRQEVAV